MGSKIIDLSKVRCPLCHGKFKTFTQPHPRNPKIIEEFAFCRRCQVNINVRDSHFLHWEAIEPVKCPRCEENMRVFTRSDGYIKGFCTYCKLQMETMDEGDPRIGGGAGGTGAP